MPVAPLDPGGTREPSALYNGMINPLTRYAIRGVLWYQGESNTPEPALYGKLFPAMIGAWRTAWDGGAFPFLYAQLSGFLARRAEPGESRWAELREAQSQALSVAKTGMVVTADTGEEHEMHPADKQDVGHRFALLAEKTVYGQQDVVASGPVFSSMEISGGKAVLTFTHAEGGLVATTGTLTGFAVGGADGSFVWANAQISANKVIVQSPKVPDPVAVRYGWADFPDGTLGNGVGLPAAPFRTDGEAEGTRAARVAP
jgi:sialate O-acetylesterase